MQEDTGELENLPAQTQDVSTDEPDPPPPQTEGELEQRGGGDGKAKALGKPGLGDFGRPNRGNK